VGFIFHFGSIIFFEGSYHDIKNNHTLMTEQPILDYKAIYFLKCRFEAI